jgi:hypothetical protein
MRLLEKACAFMSDKYRLERMKDSGIGSHAAVVCYVGMVLVIMLEPRGRIWDTIALVLFVAGVLLMLGAVIVEFLELEMGRDTVKLEIQDVMVEHERDSVDDEHCYPRR